ncbi:MAG: hypothetical protein QM503_02120 [Bacteroidota bacterium]
MSHFRLKHIVFVFLIVFSTHSFAFKSPQTSDLREKTFRHADLAVSQVYLHASQASGPDFARRLSNLTELGVTPESAFLDVRSGRFGTIFTSIPLLPGNGQKNTLKWSKLAGKNSPTDINHHKKIAWEAFINFLIANKPSLGIDLNELQKPGTITIFKGGDLVQINAKRFVNGVPVRDSFINAVINHGNLTLFGTRNWGDVNTSDVATISQQSARENITQYLGDLATQVKWGKTSLLYIPVSDISTQFRLVWAIKSQFKSDDLAQWEALVDAHSGELVAFEDKSNYASTRQLIGGQFPLSNDGVTPDGVEVTSPMPFANILVAGQTYYTDTGGNVMACLTGDMSTTLEGKYITMIDTCGATIETGTGPILDLGSGSGTDCATPVGSGSNGNTHSSRSGYYELNRIVEMAQAQLPNNEWLRNPVPSQMNINDNCNASGGAGGFRFFTSGGGCANTGEIAGVFDHEWGHGMDASDANPGVSNPPEGIADIFASLRLNTSCIGRNFREGTNCTGFGDACTQCDGVRDIDWEKRASGQPHTLSWIDANCGSGPSPCGGIVHCEGAVAAESLWDLWNRDLQVPPYNMSTDTAREMAVQLTFQGAGLVGDWYSCSAGTGVGDGCNADGGYLNYLAADDDDGNLANGTPHMTAIFEAFDRHGIACPTPTVQDSGCSGLPLTAPTVIVSTTDRTVHLSWNTIANASGYRIYRTEGVQACDYGKTLIGETTALEFEDIGLSNGREYSYIVIPMGSGASCLGVASTCTSATPTSGANLGLDIMSTVLTVNTGDGDNYLDNCEQATVDFSIANLGTGIANGVVIESVESISHPSINSSIVINNISSSGLAECTLTNNGFSFKGENLSFNDVIDFKVCVTSAELAPEVKCGIVSIENTESNDQFQASKTFSFETDYEGWTVNRGTFDRTSGSAASGSFALRSSTFLDNQCDEILSPLIKFSNTSTLSMQTNYDIENISGGIWWDRAHVSVFENNTENLITPTGGRPYNATVSSSYTGCNSQFEGWAGTASSWAESSWSTGTFTGYAGNPVQLAITYGTDGASIERGFWADTITITDIELQVADEQPNVCINGIIFKDGFEN